MSTPEKKEFLFVYGTLRNSPRNSMHRILSRNAHYVGRGLFPGKLYDIGHYPGAVSSRDGSRISGEVYALDDSTVALKELDEYEGCSPRDPAPHEFRRVKENISMLDGSDLVAWIYLYNLPISGLKLIRSGDYVNYKES